MQEELIGFWEGSAIQVGLLRRGLEQTGAAKLFALETIGIKELGAAALQVHVSLAPGGRLRRLGDPPG